MIVTPNDIFLYNNGTECFNRFKRDNLVKLSPRNIPILVFYGACESGHCASAAAHCFYQFTSSKQDCGTTVLKVKGSSESYFKYLKITENDVMNLYGETIYRHIKNLIWLSKYRIDDTSTNLFHRGLPSYFARYMLSKNETQEDEFDKLIQEELGDCKYYQMSQEDLRTEIDDWMIHTPCKVIKGERIESIELPL